MHTHLQTALMCPVDLVSKHVEQDLRVRVSAQMAVEERAAAVQQQAHLHSHATEGGRVSI